MHCDDYRKGYNKAKVSSGFDMNQSMPSKIFFADSSKADEHPFISRKRNCGLSITALIIKYTGLSRTGLASLRKKSQPSISSDGTSKYSSAGGNAILKSTTSPQEVNTDSWRKYSVVL